MTQAWDKAGKRHAITVIKLNPHVVTQLKTTDADGYQAIQVGVGSRKKLNKPLTNHLAKSKSTPQLLREVKAASTDFAVGDPINLDQIVTIGDTVIVRSKSKGKGFAGTMKRHGFGGGPRTHGQSDRSRAPGSIGQGTDPGRVHKGKKMAGRMGNQQVAIKSLMVVHMTDTELWINGPVPGSRGALVTITKTGTQEFVGLKLPKLETTKSSPATKDQSDKATATKQETA